MIVNTEIKSGFAHVSRVGKYFTLISAAGLVQVVLKLAGAVKLDTKMWVGMSFNAPIDFDEIVIYGDDAAVEFWAGNISMHQSRSSIQGATAIRTSNILLNGEAQLTGSDLLRQSVRIRSDKDIAIFGAGVGSGWAVKAGELEDIPVSGVVRGFKRIPIVDLSKTELTTESDDFWGVSTDVERPFYWVSGDGRVKIKATANYLYASFDGGAFALHPQFDDGAWSDYQFSSHPNGKLYMVKRDNDFVSFWSCDDGGLFELIKAPQNIQDLTDENFGWSTHTFQSFVIGDTFTNIWSGGQLHFDIVTHSLRIEVKKPTDKTYRSRANIYDGYILEVEHNSYSTSKGKLKRSFDDGETWEYDTSSTDYSDLDPSFLTVDPSGKYVVIRQSSYLFLSDDYGLSFSKCAESKFYLSGKPVHVAGGVWVVAQEGKLYGLQLRSDGVATVEAADLAVLTGRAIRLVLLSDGGLFAANSNSGAELQLSVDGDLAPATVEIMELLS